MTKVKNPDNKSKVNVLGTEPVALRDLLYGWLVAGHVVTVVTPVTQQHRVIVTRALAHLVQVQVQVQLQVQRSNPKAFSSSKLEPPT